MTRLRSAVVYIVMACVLQACRPVAAPPVVTQPQPAATACVLRVTTLAGAAVTLVTDVNPSGPSGVAGADGEWSTRVPSPGDYDVSATRDGYRCEQVHVAVAVGQTEASVSVPCAALPPPAPPVVRGRLRVDGRRMVYPDGSTFVWRGATAFLLTEQVATGRAGDARAFARWAHGTGFSIVRVLVMLPGGWTDGHELTPEDGLAALPQLLRLLEAEDIYAHVTALANTASLPNSADLGGYVEQAGRICAQFVACGLLEVANEPYHPTQRRDVHDVATLERWAKRVPQGVPVALGPSADDESREMAGAPVTTVHLDRGRDPWNMVRRIRELETLSADTGRFVVNSEPIGAAEADEPGRRIANASIHAAFGVLSRVFGVGSTWHSESGLRAQLPGPVQQAAADAFIAGSRVVFDATMLSFRNAGWPGAPILRARWAEGPPRTDATVRAYSGIAGDSGVLVLLGVRGNPGVEIGNGWSLGPSIAEWPELRVSGIRR